MCWTRRVWATAGGCVIVLLACGSPPSRQGAARGVALWATVALAGLALSGCSKLTSPEISCSSAGATDLVISQMKTAELAHPAMLATASDDSEGQKAVQKQAQTEVMAAAQAQHDQSAKACELQFRDAYAKAFPDKVDQMDQEFTACVQAGGVPGGFDGYGSVNDACTEKVRDDFIVHVANPGFGGGNTDDLSRQIYATSDQLVPCMEQSRQPLRTIQDQVDARVRTATRAVYDKAVWELSAIRTQAKDKDTGKVSCLTNLKVTLPPTWDGATKTDLPYTVEKTSDGKLYVTLDAGS